MKEEGRGFYCIQCEGVALSQGCTDHRKLKRETVQNPTSAKIATLENFLLYGNICTCSLLVLRARLLPEVYTIGEPTVYNIHSFSC